MPLQGEYAPGTSDWARRQADQFVGSRGAEAATLGGRPIVVLTSVGARTGKLRRTPLMRVEHDGRYAAVASLGGAARNPRWVANLRDHPHVELQDGALTRDYTAREVDGTERQGWWRRAVEAYPPYERYRRRRSDGSRCSCSNRWVDAHARCRGCGPMPDRDAELDAMVDMLTEAGMVETRHRRRQAPSASDGPRRADGPSPGDGRRPRRADGAGGRRRHRTMTVRHLGRGTLRGHAVHQAASDERGLGRPDARPHEGIRRAATSARPEHP